MNKIIKKLITITRKKFIPSEHDKELDRWISDGGDEMLRYDYDLSSNSIVLDLGGYKGQWASNIYSRYNCQILVFEPVKLFAEKIKNRFKNNPNIKVFDFALGAQKRKETIFLNENKSSIYMTTSQKETILVDDVEDFFWKYKLENIDLMKVNIEGGEYELMSKIIETGIITKIKHIQIQFHNIAPDSEEKMNEIRQTISKTHFPTYQYKFVWENWTIK